jgi:hypothetical protein
MKRGIAAFVGVFCIVSLIVSGAYAKKPNNPGQSDDECIKFEGQLDSGGWTILSGCCPNAGPSPAFTMNLSHPDITFGTYTGQLFVKPVRTRVNRQWTERWKVQFWTWDWATQTPGDDDYFFEIYGDNIVEDENGVTVTFENDTATVWVYYAMDTDCDPCDTSCDPCPTLPLGVPPACDLCESDCRHPHGYCCLHPCNEKNIIGDVTFELVKTSDLTYCE